MSRSRAKGTAWETAIVAYLQSRGWPHAERRAASGNQDRGDIAGVVGVCIEAKNAARVELGQWMGELAVESARDRAAVAALWIKRRGKSSPADGYVVLSGDGFTRLLTEAGYR